MIKLQLKQLIKLIRELEKQGNTFPAWVCRQDVELLFKNRHKKD